MNITEKELERQEEDRGNSEDLQIVKAFLKCCKTTNQWLAFIKVEFVRYGTQSYQTHRYYHPTDELRNLYKAFREME
jgi:hypothetical protein